MAYKPSEQDVCWLQNHGRPGQQGKQSKHHRKGLRIYIPRHQLKPNNKRESSDNHSTIICQHNIGNLNILLEFIVDDKGSVTSVKPPEGPKH